MFAKAKKHVANYAPMVALMSATIAFTMFNAMYWGGVL